jgi:hypothetical protein
MSQLTDFLTHALKSVIFFYNYFSSRKLYGTTGRESCGRLLLLFVWKKADSISALKLQQPDWLTFCFLSNG